MTVEEVVLKTKLVERKRVKVLVNGMPIGLLTFNDADSKLVGVGIYSEVLIAPSEVKALQEFLSHVEKYEWER